MSKILWVDDDVNNPELRPDKDALEEKGHNLTLVSNTAEFIELLDETKNASKYDCIIIDMMMPPGKVFDMKESDYGGRTGFLLIDRIKKNPSYNDAPIIVYSIVKAQDLINEYKRGKKDIHFLEKPGLLSDEFVEEVEKVIKLSTNDHE